MKRIINNESGQMVGVLMALALSAIVISGITTSIVMVGRESGRLSAQQEILNMNSFLKMSFFDPGDCEGTFANRSLNNAPPYGDQKSGTSIRTIAGQELKIDGKNLGDYNFGKASTGELNFIIERKMIDDWYVASMMPKADNDRMNFSFRPPKVPIVIKYAPGSNTIESCSTSPDFIENIITDNFKERLGEAIGSCSGGQYMKGIGLDGKIICRDLPDPTTVVSGPGVPPPADIPGVEYADCGTYKHGATVAVITKGSPCAKQSNDAYVCNNNAWRCECRDGTVKTYSLGVTGGKCCATSTGIPCLGGEPACKDPSKSCNDYN